VKHHPERFENNGNERGGRGHERQRSRGHDRERVGYGGSSYDRRLEPGRRSGGWDKRLEARRR